MTLSKVPILGVSVTTSTRQAILSFLSKRLSVKSTHLPISQSIVQIVTPNPEQIVLAQKDAEFRRILNSADVALPDGAGLVWAMKHFYSVIPAKAGILLDHGIPAQGRNDKYIERIPGREFMIELCRIAAEKNKRVLLYGGRGGVAEEALRKLKQVIPNLDGLAIDGAEIEGETIPTGIVEEIVRTIRGRNVHIVFIGLGAPKQEYLMEALKHTFKGETLHGVYSNLVVMAVGGAFDMLAGKISRAPKLVQQMGFEWLWRLIQEPSRWKRQGALLMFILLVLTKKIRDN